MACYESNHVIIFLSLIIIVKFSNFQNLSFFSLSSLLAVLYHLSSLDVFTIFFSFLWTLFYIFVHFQCDFHADWSKICQNLHKNGHFDFKMSTLSMMFQGTWALILALIWIAACISARKLKCSPKRRFAGIINRNLAISYWAYCNVSG